MKNTLVRWSLFVWRAPATLLAGGVGFLTKALATETSSRLAGWQQIVLNFLRTPKHWKLWNWAIGNFAWGFVSPLLGWAFLTIAGLAGFRIVDSTFNNPWKADLPQPCSDKTLCIVIAGLQGDADGKQTENISYTLRRAFDERSESVEPQIVLLPKRLERTFAGNLQKNEKALQDKARTWLRRQSADALIYGYVAQQDEVVRLQIVTQKQSHVDGYNLTGSKELPSLFSADLGKILALEIVYSARAKAELTPQKIARLRALAENVEHLLENQEELSLQLVSGEAWSALGNAYLVLSQTNLNAGDLAKSVLAFERSLAAEEDSPDTILYRRAGLCAALMNSADRFERKEDWGRAKTACQDAAASTYRQEKKGVSVRAQTNAMVAETKLAALTGDLPRADVALSDLQAVLNSSLSAADKNLQTFVRSRLAIALHEHGKISGDRFSLARALSAQLLVVEDIDQSNDPESWAQAQQNLSSMLVTMGQVTGDDGYLQKAIDSSEMVRRDYGIQISSPTWVRATISVASAYQELGEVHRSESELNRAVAEFESALAALTKETQPQLWADVRGRLGVTYFQIGVLRDDSESYLRSIDQYDCALEVYNRVSNGGKWAEVQRNLGAALTHLGKKEKSTDLLDAAVFAFEEALEVWHESDAPAAWASTQFNLGVAALGLAQLTKHSEEIEEALVYYDAAARVIRKENDPRGWALLQQNMAATKYQLGLMTGNNSLMLEALEKLNAAKSVLTGSVSSDVRQQILNTEAAIALEYGRREGDPSKFVVALVAAYELRDIVEQGGRSVDLAAVENLLGIAHLELGKSETAMQHLEASIRLFESAAQRYDDLVDEHAYALTMQNLGQASYELGMVTGNVFDFETALDVSVAAASILARNGTADERELSAHWIGMISYILGYLKNNADLLNKSADSYRLVLETRTKESNPYGWAWTMSNLAGTLREIGTREHDRELLEEAISKFHGALEVRTPEESRDNWLRTKMGLGTALLALGEAANSEETLESAKSVFAEVLVVADPDAYPVENAQICRSLAKTHKQLSLRIQDTHNEIEIAISYMKCALDGFERVHLIQEASDARLWLSEAEQTLLDSGQQ